MKCFVRMFSVLFVMLLCPVLLFAAGNNGFFFRGGIGGGGIDDIPLHMVTDKGSELYIDNYNGLNLAITAGYKISPLFSAELQTGSMKMNINQTVSNGDGYFKTTPLFLLLNYKIVHRDSYDLYLAGGLSWFLSPELHREGPGVTDTIKYDNAVGPYLSAGGAYRFDPKWSMYCEIGIPMVEYKFSSGTENGMNITAPFSDWDNIGSGVVFYFGIGYNY